MIYSSLLFKIASIFKWFLRFCPTTNKTQILNPKPLSAKFRQNRSKRLFQIWFVHYRDYTLSQTKIFSVIPNCISLASLAISDFGIGLL